MEPKENLLTFKFIFEAHAQAVGKELYIERLLDSYIINYFPDGNYISKQSYKVPIWMTDDPQEIADGVFETLREKHPEIFL